MTRPRQTIPTTSIKDRYQRPKLTRKQRETYQKLYTVAGTSAWYPLPYEQLAKMVRVRTTAAQAILDSLHAKGYIEVRRDRRCFRQVKVLWN